MSCSYSPKNSPRRSLFDEPWSDNYKLQSIFNADWYKAVDLSKALIEIKKLPLNTKDGKYDALDILKNCSLKLDDIPVDNNTRFPDGPLDLYVCDAIDPWGEYFSVLWSKLQTDSEKDQYSTKTSAQMHDSIVLETANTMFYGLMDKTKLIKRETFESYFNLNWDMA